MIIFIAAGIALLIFMLILVWALYPPHKAKGNLEHAQKPISQMESFPSQHPNFQDISSIQEMKRPHFLNSGKVSRHSLESPSLRTAVITLAVAFFIVIALERLQTSPKVSSPTLSPLASIQTPLVQEAPTTQQIPPKQGSSCTNEPSEGRRCFNRVKGIYYYRGEDFNGDYDFDEDDIVKKMMVRKQLLPDECWFYINSGKNDIEKKKRKMELERYVSYPKTLF